MNESNRILPLYLLNEGFASGTDLNGLIDPGHITSYNDILYVVDSMSGSIFAFYLDTGQPIHNYDFTKISVSDGSDIKGIWTDGATMWVAEDNVDKIRAFDLATKEEDTSKEFGTLDSDNDDPQGIWSDGTTMWVADSGEMKIFAYNMETKARDSSDDFDTLSAVGMVDIRGIWSDGENMYVVNRSLRMEGVLVFGMITKRQVTTMQFSSFSDSGNLFPVGIWSNNEVIWISDEEDTFIYGYDYKSRSHNFALDRLLFADVLYEDPILWEAIKGNAESTSPAGIWIINGNIENVDSVADTVFSYSFESEARQSGEDLVLESGAGTNNPRGIWRNEEYLWVSDATDAKLYTYIIEALIPGGHVLKDFDLYTVGSHNYCGAWSDGTTVWIADRGQSTIDAYKLSTGERDTDKGFSLSSNNQNPRGIWSDGVTIWVAETNGDDLHAYTLATGSSNNSKTINLHSNNGDPRGIWSDGTTMWVSDWVDDKIYAYVLSTGSRDSSKDFNTLSAAGNNRPTGMWSDGTTMWVGDWDDGKLYAYVLSSRLRDSDEDIDLISANGRPWGIWSDGTVLYVVDNDDEKIYAYNFPSSQPCLLYTSPSPRDRTRSRMPSSA